MAMSKLARDVKLSDHWNGDHETRFNQAGRMRDMILAPFIRDYDLWQLTVVCDCEPPDDYLDEAFTHLVASHNISKRVVLKKLKVTPEGEAGASVAAKIIKLVKDSSFKP